MCVRARVRRCLTCLAFTPGAILCSLHGCAFSNRCTRNVCGILLSKKKHRLITLAESTVTSVMSDITCCYLYFSIGKRAKSTVVPLCTCRPVKPLHALRFPFLPHLWVVTIVNLLRLVAPDTELNHFESFTWVEFRFHKHSVDGYILLFPFVRLQLK